MGCNHEDVVSKETWFTDRGPILDYRCRKCGAQVPPPWSILQMVAARVPTSRILGHPEQPAFEDGEGNVYFVRDLPSLLKPVRLLVCGGRDFADRSLLFRHLDALHAERPVTVVIDGGARGADELAGQWAEARGIEHLRFPADWERHGRSAGPRRNHRMLVEGMPHLVVAFPGGRGTANMLKQAAQAGVKTMGVA